MSIVKFIPGKSPKWVNYNINDFDIWIASDNAKAIAQNTIVYLTNNLINEKSISEMLSGIFDHYGIIITCDKWFLAAVDTCRSYPIYWNKNNEQFLLSNQANKIAKYSKSNINNIQKLAFQMSGYTIADGTFWSDIYNLNGGEYIFYDKSGKFCKKKYFQYNPWQAKDIKFDKLKLKLMSEINKILDNLILKADGRTIAIPLSAGLDSRLIASGLKFKNYKNVKCFSYGLKNNFESKASEKIAKALGFEWKFIQINYINARKYYQSKEFKLLFQNCNDGCATPGMQDSYAIKILLEEKYLNNNDLIVNGNSGDYLSGGHLPNNSMKWNKEKDIKKICEIIFNEHYKKHYSLWESLKTPKNKNLIKNEIIKQINSFNINIKNGISPHGILELLEYENRQSKYVINFQRVYDFYNLSWSLPLWDYSFIKFWSTVPPKYKFKQNLYKEVLFEMNMGDVWTDEYTFKQTISPLWIRIFRSFIKIAFIFFGKKKWHQIDSKYFYYWIDNILGQCLLPYIQTIKNNNGPRHFVSWHTLYAEEITLKSNWQKIDFKK